MSEAAQPERVLVVDDEPVMLDVLSRFLRRAGFLVTEASSVGSALDELAAAASRSERFHHAVVDLVLRDGDGEDVLKACEALAPRPNVVVLSGNIDSRRALDLAGRCLYLPKPVAAKTLVEALQRRRDPIADFVAQHGLTPREREAIVVAVHGFFNEDAAEALGVSKEGLRKRWRQICAKTGCATQQRVLAKIIRALSEGSRDASGVYPSITSTRGQPAARTRRARG